MSNSYFIFQIVKYKNGSGFGLHEVYYNGDDEPWDMTEEPEVLNHLGPDIDNEPVTAEGLKQSMALMLSDAIRHNVLEEPEEWANPPWHGLGEMGDLNTKKAQIGGPPIEIETDDLLHDGRREEEPEVESDE